MSWLAIQIFALWHIASGRNYLRRFSNKLGLVCFIVVLLENASNDHCLSRAVLQVCLPVWRRQRESQWRQCCALLLAAAVLRLLPCKRQPPCKRDLRYPCCNFADLLCFPRRSTHVRCQCLWSASACSFYLTSSIHAECLGWLVPQAYRTFSLSSWRKKVLSDRGLKNRTACAPVG